jgi:hypothetical protein
MFCDSKLSDKPLPCLTCKYATRALGGIGCACAPAGTMGIYPYLVVGQVRQDGSCAHYERQAPAIIEEEVHGRCA